MSQFTFLVIVGVFIFVTAVSFVLWRLYVSVKKLNDSFGKLGYITREDAKKYFHDASEKVVDMYSQFYVQNQEMLKKSMDEALKNSGFIMEDSISKAQLEASRTMAEARESAQRMARAAEKEAQEKVKGSLDTAVRAIEWTLEEYVKQKFDAAQHEEIINRLLKVYIDERK